MQLVAGSVGETCAGLMNFMAGSSEEEEGAQKALNDMGVALLPVNDARYLSDNASEGRIGCTYLEIGLREFHV